MEQLVYYGVRYRVPPELLIIRARTPRGWLDVNLAIFSVTDSQTVRRGGNVVFIKGCLGNLNCFDPIKEGSKIMRVNVRAEGAEKPIKKIRAIATNVLNSIF
jgi:hypothetical protein